MTDDEHVDDQRRPRRWWRRGRRARGQRRATVLFDSRRRSDHNRTRSGEFDPTEASRHLIYRIGDNDIAISAYLQTDAMTTSMSLTGHILGPMPAPTSIGARPEDGARRRVLVGPDGSFLFDLLPGRSVLLDHERDGDVTTLGSIELAS